jgi:hypothetical protein
VPGDLAEFRFAYWPAHDPADLDDDPQTDDDYPPEYYALALMRVNVDGGTGEWSYLALGLEPDRISLREWAGDEVTELAHAQVVTQAETWYPVR